METQAKQGLSFSDVLRNFLGKEIYVCTTQDYNGPMVVKGVVTSFNDKEVVLNETFKSCTIIYNCIDCISLVNHDDEFINIETDSPSDFNNPFYSYLNQHVECLSSWWRAGLLTYVGTDYVTFLIDGDLTYSYLLVNQISEMTTC